jgi:hypothetical protein
LSIGTGDGVTLFGRIELPERTVEMANNDELVRLLVDAGASRLTAERLVELERGEGEPGRARRHRAGR